MRTPEEIYEEWLNGDVADSTVDFFREIQKEAWNEATLKASKDAYQWLVDYDSSGTIENSILKNIIQ